MISKGFLSGIFSVVSFILISNLAIPSTFAECPPDVSGTWVARGGSITECCPDPSDNGTEKIKSSFVVTQVGDEISASWDVEGGHNELTGIVNGNSVYFKVEGTDSDEPCGWIDHAVGIIKGNRIKGVLTDATTCNTCRTHVKFSIKIVK